MAKLARNNYGPVRQPLTALPFIADVRVAPRKTARSFWAITPPEDYAAACSVGRQYAADLLEYLRCNPDVVGMNILGAVVADMHRTATQSPNGVAAGFCSTLERMLFEAAIRVDHFSVIQAAEDQYEAILTARATEQSTKGAA